MRSVKGERRSRLLMSALVVGLDVHKESFYATVLDQNGKMINQMKMSNGKVLSYLSHFSVDKVAMEACSSAVPLYRQLASEGYNVSVSHPKKTRYISEAKIKSDRVDSTAIAELARLDALPLAYMPDETIAALREKVRRGAFLVRQRVKIRVKTKSVTSHRPQIKEKGVRGGFRQRLRLKRLSNIVDNLIIWSTLPQIIKKGEKGGIGDVAIESLNIA